ncbi:MAG: flagellar hook-associated protein FlgL [Tepidisphaeraceae bacterium]
MSVQPLALTRVSNLLRGNLAMRSITDAQKQLLEVQQQISTGKRLTAPSDDVGDAAIAMQVRKLLEARDSYTSNLKQADTNLSSVDSTLQSLTDLVRQAKDVASANVGSDVSDEERQSAATVVDSLFDQIFTLGNQQVAGNYLFGGDRSTDAPFLSEGGGVKWVGSSTLLSNVMDEGTEVGFQVDGAQVFGALSTMVKGRNDVSPSLTGATRLDDLRGTAGTGVKRGIVALSNGTTTVQLDFGNADTMQDVIDKINAAGLGGVTASINAAGTGIDITGGATDDLTVTEVGGGTFAADMGIKLASGAGGGVPINGGAIKPRITNLTPIATLNGGTGLDTAGLTITNGGATQQIDLSGAVTVEDVLNKINTSGTGVKAQINAAGTGLDIFNAVQGISMRISENGGATADQLGVRSFDTTTNLSDLNGGEGVPTINGAEIRITDTAGVSIDIDLDGVNTVQDLITKINDTATLNGAGIDATFGAQNNGIVISNTAGGGGTLKIEDLAVSGATKALGLDVDPVADTVNGKDVNPIDSYGLFGNLDALRIAMRSNDQAAMTKAASKIEDDLNRIVEVRGKVGAKVQEFEGRQNKIEDENVSTKSFLSELEDTDFNDAITKFQTLQTSLQASLQAATKTMNLSLMDYL